MIFGNIKHGLLGTADEHESEKAIHELVERAARMAKGQVSNPKILLLDEATSALDKAAQGRTTVIIAHQLSTIKNIDCIVVMSHGRIVEQGTHDDLLQKKGAYHNLADAQRIATKQESRNQDEDPTLPETDYNLRQPEFKENRYISDKEVPGEDPDDLQEQEDIADNYTLFMLIRFVAGLNKKEWKYIDFGLLLSAVCGGGNPTQAVFFAKCITALSLPLSESSEIWRQVNFWLLMFQFFLRFSAVIFGTQSAGTIFNFAPDIAKARYAAASLKALFDWTPDIDSWSHDGETVQSIEGHVEFRNVHFRYPMRPNQLILRGLNLHVKPGQYVAFVGASGCGKSTAIALLERFYNPVLGGVYVDGQEISSLNINNYRSHLALASQEPTLYQGTNRENIMLGTDRDDVSEDEMVLYCKNANIYDFIISLPDGFNTLIARALLCNPRILLLDEATSALDSGSEKLVQATLDTAAQGRTTIAVAHRLSTVQKADMIYVFNQGCSIECETHSELMQKRSAYFELVSLQNLGEMRGDYSTQIAAVEKENDQPSSPSSAADEVTSGLRLLGFVPTYSDYFRTYHGVLYLGTERDWRTSKREMCQMLFDPCSDEEWADWREDSDLEVQPATQLQWSPLDQGPPVPNPPVVGSVAQEMHLISNL
ncbi:P-loop containing nucleoside triphosphate hydrolase protein [Aspergillus falconensis]